MHRSLVDIYENTFTTLSERLKRDQVTDAYRALGYDVASMPDGVSVDGMDLLRARLAKFKERVSRSSDFQAAFDSWDRLRVTPLEAEYIAYQTWRRFEVGDGRIQAERDGCQLVRSTGDVQKTIRERITPFLRRARRVATVTMANCRGVDRLNPSDALLHGLEELPAYASRFFEERRLWQGAIGAPGGPAGANVLARGGAFGSLVVVARGLVSRGECSDEMLFHLTADLAGLLFDCRLGPDAARKHRDLFLSEIIYT
jgi:hypothetical protein